MTWRAEWRRAGVLIPVVTLALHLSAAPAMAFSYPGYVSSWYMDTVSTTTLYDMGCALGTARSGGSAPQDALVILDYGQPQLRSGVYGSYDFSNSYRTVTQIRNAVVEYAHGFYLCTGSNLTAHVRIAVGTTNFADFSRTAGLTATELVAHAKAWANMVDGINNDISAKGYQRQADAVGAADIEVGWGKPTTARSWVDAYDTVNQWSMYDFGDAAGCRQSGTVKAAGTCSYYTPDDGIHKYYWHQNDLYYVAWQASPAWGVPQIYREDGAQAKQWQQISKWATLNALGRMAFAGSLTQHGACGTGCSGTNNTASEGWTQLRDKCAADSATALASLRFAADIKRH